MMSFDITRQIQTRVRVPQRECARVVHLSLAPLEGVGNAGCPLHPRPRVPFVLVERTRVTTSTPESPDIPARNGFTAYVGLSPVTGLFCHRRQRAGDRSQVFRLALRSHRAQNAAASTASRALRP